MMSMAVFEDSYSGHQLENKEGGRKGKLSVKDRWLNIAIRWLSASSREDETLENSDEEILSEWVWSGPGKA